jgi:hypothetical protein
MSAALGICVVDVAAPGLADTSPVMSAATSASDIHVFLAAPIAAGV